MTSVYLVPSIFLALLYAAQASAGGLTSDRHGFKPLVAFQCGFRNMYQTESRVWVHDNDRYATCLSGKLDILKYCQRTYPNMNITNIVEFTHNFDISNWCREEGDNCKFRHVVRPYLCIEDEFQSEALQVPKDCIFSHISSRKVCQDNQYWEKKAKDSCSDQEHNQKKMRLNSFALLEPCGLDIFTGVELVCCPPDVPKPDDVIVAKTADLKPKAEDEDDDEEDDDDEDFYTFGDDEDAKQDSYFTKIDLSHEHDRFMDALDRLEKKYKSKIDKVMKEWYELKGRYTTMKDKDPKEAEKMKSEMTTRFQTTVNSLEEEHTKARQEVRTVHDERVSTALNEKKRIATHEYRRALVNQVMRPNRIEVLKALKKYIRAEEKDRLHQLNKYRHLLHGAPGEAKEFKPSLLHKLHEIDLRINATLSMLRDFPDIEQQIQAIIMGYWKDFRHENTPSIDDIEINQTNSLDSDAKNKKLIDVYTESIRKEHIQKSVTTTTTAAPKPELNKVKAVDLEKDSEEDSDDYYEDEGDEEVERVKIQTKPTVKKVEAPADEPVQVHRKFTELKPITTTSEESESESSEEDSDEIVEKEIRVNIEPIITETEYSANIRESLMNDIKKRAVDSQVALSQLLFLFGSILCLALIGLTILKRRNARHGFVEVDVYTSEERHLAGMQVNGYENPTYSFFDSKN